MTHKQSFKSMPSQQSYAPASPDATAEHWDAGLKSGQGSSALSAGGLATQQLILAASKQLHTCIAGLTLSRKHAILDVFWHMRIDALRHHVFQMDLTYVIV